MADPLQTAITPAASNAPIAPDAGLQQRTESWKQYFARPDVRAALIQFGIGMLQPRQAGQTFAGQVGQSIGQGAAAAGRVAEFQRLIARDQREQQRLDQQASHQGEQLKLQKEELQLAKGKAASDEQQRAIDNAYKQEELKLKAQNQKILDRYYQGILARPQDPSRTLPAGYQEALDVAKTEAGLADDPLESFFLAKQAIDQQFGLTTGGGGYTAASGATASPMPPPQVGEVRDGWRFKGGDPAQQSNWEKVK
jgi:hypothetical protein